MAATTLLLASAVSSQAQTTLYWDTNSTTLGSGTNPTGTWSTSASNWTTDSTGSAATAVYTNSSAVVFSAGSDAVGPATITVNSAGVTATSMTFNNGAYTIANGTNTLLLGIGNQAAGTYTANFITLNASSGAVTISGPIQQTNNPNTVNQTANFTNNSASLLTFNGTVANQVGTGTFNINLNGTGSGGVTFAGAIFE